MCGIAGLFLKDPALEPRLGDLLARMTATLCGRGPDSAGFAIYGPEKPGVVKFTVQGTEETNFDTIASALAEALAGPVSFDRHWTHAVFHVPRERSELAESWFESRDGLVLVSRGSRLEIFKEVGYPEDVAEGFGIAAMSGTHAVAHTRMATESAVTTDGAHPFSTGADQCLVHNGSLSNHASLRRILTSEGIRIRTANDSEVAAGYLTRELREGKSLGEALGHCLTDLDGFYTFVIGTEDGFGVLRDPIACKPAVMAETEAYVAFASEYRSLTCLPGIRSARIWEPEPAKPYFWEHS